jgi:PhzF family phenazine biosynthesis protein
MSSADMQDVARRFGHESGFVFSPKSGDYDFSFRFFVPNHEMEMCGHATIGALWVLMRQGRLPAETVRIETRSGPVTGFVTLGSDGQPAVEIRSRPAKLFRFAGMRRRRFCRCWVSGGRRSHRCPFTTR